MRNTKPKVLTSLVLTILVVTPASGRLTSDFSNQAVQPNSPWQGRDIFEHKGCSKCHAVYGRGGEGGPDLGKEKFYGTYVDLAALMWNHVPKMLKKMEKRGYQFPELSNEEMGHIVSYLSYTRYYGDEGKVRLGEKLLGSKRCRECHMIGGSGGDIGPVLGDQKEYLTPLVLIESMWNHGPDMVEYIEEHELDWPKFKGDDIVHITAAIRSYMRPTKVPLSTGTLGDPEKGQMIVEAKKCTHCHSTRGVGGDTAPDFLDLDFNHSVMYMAGRMWNHGPKMWESMKEENIPFPTFEEGEMVDVIAYLYKLHFEADPGDHDRGREVARERCLTCHSYSGEGTGVAPDLTEFERTDTPVQMITTMWNHAPLMWEKHREKKVKWPKLNGGETADLFAFLQSLAAPGESH